MSKCQKIKELKTQLDIERKTNEYLLHTLAQEKMRIDNLVRDIESRFNKYMEEYSKANAILTMHNEVPVFRVYADNEQAKPIEYGEIRIPALYIKFIKGEK